MKAQIYSIISVEEGLACIEAGADHIGVLVQQEGWDCPCAASIDTAKAIFDAIGDKAVKVLIPATNEEDLIIDFVLKTGPDVVHLSGAYKSNPAFVKKLKTVDPNIKIMQAIGVIGKESVDEAHKLNKDKEDRNNNIIRFVKDGDLNVDKNKEEVNIPIDLIMKIIV